MTCTDSTLERISALDTQPAEMCLRFPDGQQQRLLMPTGKATLGAGAGCTIPIRYPGVGPLHCVLFPIGAGWRVRRWSSETLLNGGVFTEAPVELGDRLQLGPVEIEFAGDGLAGNATPNLDAEVDFPSDPRAEEVVHPRDAESDVFDYVPVVKTADVPAQQGALGERISEHCHRLEELEWQLAECVAQQEESRRELGDLRQQIADVRHELAHAGQLDVATREAVLELERQLADWRNTPIVAPPARPKGFGLSRRVWPPDLRRRLIAHVTAQPEPIAASNGVDPTALERGEANSAAMAPIPAPAPSGFEFDSGFDTECQSQIDIPPHDETVSAEDSEELATNEEAADLAVSPPKSFVEPESFLDKFQHLLKQDEPASEDGTGATPFSEGSVPNQLPISLTSENPPSPIGEADDSIENYMVRLLQRVRGEASSTMPDLANPVVPPTASNDSCEVGAIVEKTPPSTPRPVSNLEDIKSAPAPERSHNMAALRDLANQSAHSAIHRANVRHHRESAWTKLAVSLLGIVCGIVVVKLSPSYTSPEFIGGLVPLFAGLFWGGLTLVLLLRAVRDGSLGEAKQSERLDKQVPPDVSADEL